MTARTAPARPATTRPHGPDGPRPSRCWGSWRSRTAERPGVLFDSAEQHGSLPSAPGPPRVDGEVGLPYARLRVVGDRLGGLVAEDEGDQLAAGREHAVQDGLGRAGDVRADHGHVPVDEAE